MSNASTQLLTARNAVKGMLAEIDAGPIVVGCSGGADSLALVGTSVWAAQRSKRRLVVVCVDHGLQEGSAEVAQWAADVSRRLGAHEAHVVRVEVGHAGGPEAAARTARRAALEEAAQSEGAVGILLGHTRDDQAETVLLRLARGSGARSLSAMAPRTGWWLRPFLHLSRSAVREVAVEILAPLGETAWQDPHNEDRGFARVRVRAALTRLEQDLGAGVLVGLSRSAEALRDDADALDLFAAEIIAGQAVQEGRRWSIACDVIVGQPRAIRSRVIRDLARALGSADIDFEQIRRVDALISEWHGQGNVSLPAGVVAGRDYGRLWLLAAEGEPRDT